MKQLKAYRFITLVVIAMVCICPSYEMIQCYAEYLEVKTSSENRLADVLDGRGLDIDELIIEGYVADTDFTTMLECVVNGKLESIDLSKAILENNEIPDNAFSMSRLPDANQSISPNLKRIILPESVIRIGFHAFENTSLEYINLSEGLTVIGSYGLACTKIGLHEINLPTSLTSIGMAAFCKCPNLKTLKLSEKVHTIGDEAFAQSELEEIEFNENIQFIGQLAFKGTKIKKIDMSCAREFSFIQSEFAQMEDLEELIFASHVNPSSTPWQVAYNCQNLAKVVFPENIKVIGPGSFYNCKSLQDIKLPASIEKIAGFAFYNTNISQIIIPESVKQIEEGAFACLKSLNSIYSLSAVPPSSEQYCFYDPEADDNMTEGDIPTQTSPGCTVYVPIGSSNAYKSATGWNYFDNFVETNQFPDADINLNTISSSSVNINNGLITISRESPFHCMILSADGSIVLNSSENTCKLISELSRGIYFISISGEKTRKIIF